MLTALMVAVGLLVGLLVGCVGIGGIILIPAMTLLLSMSSHVAMGTALFSFIFSSLLGVALYIRRGRVDWKTAIPLCLGGVPFAYAGAVCKAYTAAPYLNLLLGCLMLVAGGLVFRPVQGRERAFMREGTPWRARCLFLIGAGTSFICAMTGAGGPVLSIPIMLALGCPAVSTVGAGLVFSVVVAVSGSFGNIQHQAVDWFAGGWLTLVQMVGIAMGSALVDRLNAGMLRRLAAWLCLISGSYIFIIGCLGIIGHEG